MKNLGEILEGPLLFSQILKSILMESILWMEKIGVVDCCG